MRVLHLLSCDDWAGTEVQISTQVIRSDRANTEQAVAILEPPGVVHHRLVAAGVEVYTLHGSLGILGAAIRLVRLVRRRRFHVVEAYGFRAGLLARLGLLGRDRPKLVLGIRGLHFAGSEQPDGRSTRFVVLVERLLAGTVSRYDANSNGARDFLVSRGLPEERFRVILSGAEADGVPVSSHRDGGPPKLICVARFVPGKGHALLLRALSEIRSAGVPFSCDLIGYGPSLEAMQVSAVKLGLDDHVSFLGRQSLHSVRERLADADLFVLASVGEGMPGSVLEAMAAGLPVVATDVHGTREAVIDGETGVLVPPDDPRALSEAMLELLAEPELRRTMGARGRTRVKREFSFDRVVREKHALYTELVAGS